MELSDSQTHAYQYIINNLSKERIILLEGSAGTGKTTLTKTICDFYRKTKNILVCAIAPTHKSKKIIKNILNHNTLIPISAMTIASALGKIKEHSYVGTKLYSNGNNKKLSTYQLFIIDEVSMIHDKDLRIIIEFIKNNKKQLLIIGDRNQIPCPNAHYVITETSISRADSFIFNDETITKLYLNEIVRQNASSPIIQLACYVRDHLLIDEPFQQIIYNTHFQNIIDFSIMYSVFQSHYIINQSNSCRIIAYTNSSVKTHNLSVRNQLQYNDEYVIGDLLTGYSNVGYPELIIENGEDYFVDKIIDTNNHSILQYHNLSGKLIDLRITDNNILIKKLFFINIYDENNLIFLNKIIELAEKVNSNHSTSTDYLKYMTLKNSVIFTEDIYKFQNKIFTETSFKEAHSLLFIKVNEIIVNNSIKHNSLSQKINTAYPTILETRLRDIHKIIGDSETFADKYKTIEKDIYYGYSITAHKSQGSTYDNVIVDESDFMKITNRWNFKYNKTEDRIKEKNQIRYVSYTRARENLFIAYDQTIIDHINNIHDIPDINDINDIHDIPDMDYIEH